MKAATRQDDASDAPGWRLPPHGVHQVIDPPALHLGALVVLVSTLCLDGEPLLRPISACAPLGDRIWIGFEGPGQTRANLERTGDCVVSVPQVDLSPALEAFQAAASEGAAANGFDSTGLTPVRADIVTSPRVRECYMQIECTLSDIHASRASSSAFAELKVERVHAVSDIVQADSHRIDVDTWQPLLYSFRRFFTTARVRDSSPGGQGVSGGGAGGR